MIYVTADEFLELLQIAVYQSHFMDKDRKTKWHPDDIWSVVETVGETVKLVLEHVPNRSTNELA